MNGLARRRPKNGRFAAVLIGIVATGLLTGLWFYGRPVHHVHAGLATLKSRDWERLQYELLALPHSSEYAKPSSLFSAALKLERREFVSAHRELRFAADDASLRPLAWLLAGEALYAQNRFREAEINFKRALELDPDLIDAHRWLAIAYYDIGLMHEAVVHLRRVAELDPSDARPHRVMAVIHMDLGSNAISVEDFEESFRRNPRQPDRADMLVELAGGQLSLKRYDDALQTLAACEETAEVMSMRADALYSLGDAAQAKRLAQRALAAEPQQRLSLYVLGKIALGDRHYEEAVDFFTRGAKIAPSDYDMQYMLVTALRAAGQTEEAEKRLELAEQLRLVREEFDSLLTRAIDEPYNADIRYQLGILADRLNMPHLAQSWLKAAVVLDPGHGLAQRALKKQGNASPDAALLLRGS
ncbi:MAG TPA: tetratricopeptide repeat protein [Pirellulales bacterium]|nr:tetratricopeptide repeat protein [Pirellulales bacterium]